MMKRMITIISILAVSVVFITGCTATAQVMPQTLATKTQDIVEDVKKQDNHVFEEIQNNIDLVNTLKNNIATSQEADKQKQLNSVIKELGKVTISYETLAEEKEEIRKTLLKKITAIEELQKKVATETARLNNQRNEYATALKTFHDPDPEIMRTRQAALTQAIKYIDMQLQLWNEFYNTEQQIKDETLVVQQRIDSFLSIIESSAILFREGLNLLTLQRDINDALSLFTQDLPRMEQLSRDMEQSWSHLDMLVSTLTSMSIDISH